MSRIRPRQGIFRRVPERWTAEVEVDHMNCGQITTPLSLRIHLCSTLSASRHKFPYELSNTFANMAHQTSDQPILTLEDLTSSTSLTTLLSLLFEPSPPLKTLLVPSVLLRLTSLDTPPASYSQLIDVCSEVAEGWTWEQKAVFLSGHPMIGEVKGLSAMSGTEQGGATPKVVLDR